MSGPITHSLMAAASPFGGSPFLSGVVNSLAGRSATFDEFMLLALDNNLVKAGLLGACFIFAWHSGSDAAEAERRRTILLTAVAASLLALAITKTISGELVHPRPWVQSQKLFYLDGDRLVEATPLPHRVPLGGEEAAAARAGGEIYRGDFGSFPSDHASFYMTLAAGIWMASRKAGVIALLWTLLVTLGSRVVTGQHTFLDIAAGSAIGLAVLASLRVVVTRWGAWMTKPVIEWSSKRPALSSALAFLIAFEATNTLDDVRDLKGFAEVVYADIR